MVVSEESQVSIRRRASLEERLAKKREEVDILEAKRREREGLKTSKAARAAKRVAAALRSLAKLIEGDAAEAASVLALTFDKAAKDLALRDEGPELPFPDADDVAEER